MTIGDFLCFAGTNFFDLARVIFLAGNEFLRFSESIQYPALIIFSVFSFLVRTCNRNTYFQTNKPVFRSYEYMKVIYACELRSEELNEG